MVVGRAYHNNPVELYLQVHLSFQILPCQISWSENCNIKAITLGPKAKFDFRLYRHYHLYSIAASSALIMLGQLKPMLITTYEWSFGNGNIHSL